MIDIKIDDFLEWFEMRLDEKYCHRLENIKRVFIGFVNLTSQIMEIYVIILEKIQKQSHKSQYKEIRQLLHKSLLILDKMVDKYPICLDLAYCEKFIRVFDENLNLLCSFYHSLSHYEIMTASYVKFEKNKIIQGINRLYGLHSKIKQFTKMHIQILQYISKQKKTLSFRILSIKSKLQIFKTKQHIFINFEPQFINFYTSLEQSIKKINAQPQQKKIFMKTYFQISHQLHLCQAKFEILLDGPLNYLEELKIKKKKSVNNLVQNSFQFLKWISFLLKPNPSMKNLKKLKIDELFKFLNNLIREKQNIHNSQNIPNISLDIIQQAIKIIIQLSKQLEKTQPSYFQNTIVQYKQAIISQDIKKMSHKLVDYQLHLSKYYRINEEIKDLHKLIEIIVFSELGMRVNIIFDFYTNS